MLKEYDLTSMQWFILGTIYDAGDDGVQLTLLASKLQTGLPFVTNTVNMLESKHMVVRIGSLKDSRIKNVSTTSEFKDICIKIEQSLRHKMRQSIYAHITPADLEIYIKVMYQLSEIKAD